MDLNNHPTIEHQILRGQVYYKTQLICSLFKFEKKEKFSLFLTKKGELYLRKEKKKKKKEKNPHPFFPLLFPLLIEFSIPVEGFIFSFFLFPFSFFLFNFYNFFFFPQFSDGQER